MGVGNVEARPPLKLITNLERLGDGKQRNMVDPGTHKRPTGVSQRSTWMPAAVPSDHEVVPAREREGILYPLKTINSIFEIFTSNFLYYNFAKNCI